ncbi:MAG: response regulator [Chloroflexi bacterium]|jgi:DNA-binding response OmpR family regulator|nr:response regulator [Chloroflexota bacterium]
MPKKLLFIDGSPLLTVTFEDFFRAIGFEVTSASTNYEASQLLNKFEFDLIITDFDTPCINGNKIIGELTQRSIQTPVIAHVCDKNNINYSPLVKEVVLKPASIFHLLEAIDKSLSIAVS